MAVVAPTPPLTLDEQYDSELKMMDGVLERLGFQEVDDDNWGFRAPDLADADVVESSDAASVTD